MFFARRIEAAVMQVISGLSMILAAETALAGGVTTTAPSNEQVLHALKGSPDGGFPYGRLTMDAAGALYGTTNEGGTHDLGTVFKLTPPPAGSSAWGYSVLYSFAGGSTDGGIPYAAVTFDKAGNLYGTTYSGGASGFGTVFRLTPPAKGSSLWKETIVYSFGGKPDGAYPISELTLGPDGTFYGTTAYGGVAGVNESSLGDGVVYSLRPPAIATGAWTEKVLYAFKGSKNATGDGSTAYGGVIVDASGALYGTTENGGVKGVSAYCQYGEGCGIAYKLTPPAAKSGAWTETVLWRFGGTYLDGAIPYSGLTFGPGGVLYGVATDGGGYAPYGNLNLGTVFQLTPPATAGGNWTEKTIYAFGSGGYDFIYPLGTLSLDASGALYGTASQGGSRTPVGVAGAGGVFKLTPPATAGGAWTETAIHKFTDSSGDFCKTGCFPEGGVILDGAGAIYGTTVEGGTHPEAGDNVSPGVVFKIVP
jgi:uncharacterized repeat protein (TIGR03803 family)